MRILFNAEENPDISMSGFDDCTLRSTESSLTLCISSQPGIHTERARISPSMQRLASFKQSQRVTALVIRSSPLFYYSGCRPDAHVQGIRSRRSHSSSVRYVQRCKPFDQYVPISVKLSFPAQISSLGHRSVNSLSMRSPLLFSLPDILRT